VTLWESRTSPDFFYKKGRLFLSAPFLFPHQFFDSRKLNLRSFLDLSVGSSTWKSVQEIAIGQRDHLTVALPHVLHLVVQHLVVQHLVVPNREKNVRLAEAAPIEQALHAKSLKAVKSAIHAGFGLHLKSAINLELDRASLSRIFLKTLLVKSSRRAFALNF
jgi:hypothetical protein